LSDIFLTAKLCNFGVCRQDCIDGPGGMMMLFNVVYAIKVFFEFSPLRNQTSRS
jgi:hypothetical protein